MLRRILLITLVVTALAVSAAQSSGPDMVIEPRSGTPFPVSLIPPGGTTPHWIMGTGLRDRTVFRVKIYAFGLYVDPAGAREALRPFVGSAASRLERDERFFERLLDLDFAMTLRLVMTRDIDGHAAAEAFDEALRPRMAQMSSTGGDSAAEAALESFRSYFNVDRVSTGTEIVFSCRDDGRLTSSVGGEERLPIDSRPLCRALVDVYLGKNPISNAGKRSVITGFPALLEPTDRQ